MHHKLTDDRPGWYKFKSYPRYFAIEELLCHIIEAVVCAI